MIYIAVIGCMNTEQQLTNIKEMFAQPVKLVYDSQSVTDLNYNMYEHITAFAIELQNNVLYKSSFWATGVSDKAIILLDDLNTNMLVNVDLSNLQNDSVIFDNITIDKNQSWMRASVNAMIKTCISGKKIESYFKNDVTYFFDFPDETTKFGNMFKFMWYSYRNGIKVYRA